MASIGHFAQSYITNLYDKHQQKKKKIIIHEFELCEGLDVFIFLYSYSHCLYKAPVWERNHFFHPYTVHFQSS